MHQPTRPPPSPRMLGTSTPHGPRTFDFTLAPQTRAREAIQHIALLLIVPLPHIAFHDQHFGSMGLILSPPAVRPLIRLEPAALRSAATGAPGHLGQQGKGEYLRAGPRVSPKPRVISLGSPPEPWHSGGGQSHSHCVA